MDSINRESFYYPSSTGTDQIHALRWLPPGPPKAVVQISHGITEHIGRYDAFARYLASHGYLVVGNDHLGHGLSAQGPDGLGFFAAHRGWDHATQDLHLLHERERELHPAAPYFLLGHSMGSFLARTYMICYPRALSGVILSGTGQNPGWLVTAGRLAALLESRRVGPKGRSQRLNDLCFGAYNRKFAPNRTPHDWLSLSRANVDAYVSDPLCGFIPTVGMLSDMFGGLQLISDPEQLARMDKSLPVYFFSGDQDPVGDFGKGVTRACRLFRKAGMRQVTLRLYPGGRHEMLNEDNRLTVYRHVLHWLDAHVPANPQAQ